MSPSLCHGSTLVSKVFKKLVSVFGEHNVNTQYVRSQCQQRNTPISFKVPQKKETSSIPVASQFKVSVCGLSLARTAGSNPARGMDICLL